MKDVDLFQRVNRIQLGVWIVIAVIGTLAFSPIFVLVPIVVPLIQYLAGRFARNIFDPTGATVKSRPAYSAPESLAVRGRFEDAVSAYEAAARDEPDDPEPWLRIARIERMDLRRPQRALEALRAARALVTDASPAAQMIGREIAELHLRDLDEPRRAMPELARLAAAYPDTPTGLWAARELALLKRALAEEPE